ncbi:phytanoyl-CoA dioxygenase family protein [Thalassospira sp. CH_XMU1448-2]|uniref:phytanoyl-CoA dioxygenase family protein n=1 Tax=Thalassospira sp. CH_XMU1448-2 TaxID=3107773 RepID=UPI003009B583
MLDTIDVPNLIFKGQSLNSGTFCHDRTGLANAIRAAYRPAIFNTGHLSMITPKNAILPVSWQQLNPQLSISEATDALAKIEEIGAGNGGFDGGALSDRFWDEGYFLIDDVLPADELAKLRQGIETLVANDLPPAMIYLYDEAWQVFQRLRPLLSHFLGDRIALLPHFWAWHVNPADGGRGWPPHRDYQGESAIGDDMLISLSLWVPLSNATPYNGCMYVLPRSFERRYETPVAKPEDVVLQDVRALPAGPGAVMGWRQDLYHWGSRASIHATEPRISLSLEFQNAAFDPLAEELLSLEQPPAFEKRLVLIASQFEKYRHMQDIEARTVDWANAVLELCSGNRVG